MSDHSLMDTGDLERLLASPASPARRPVYRKAAFGDAPGDECNGLISLEAVPCGGPPSAPPSAPSSYDNLSASPAAVEPSKGANGGADGAACAAERGHERRSRNLSSLLRSVSLAAASAAASTFGAEPVAEAARGSVGVAAFQPSLALPPTNPYLPTCPMRSLVSRRPAVAGLAAAAESTKLSMTLCCGLCICCCSLSMSRLSERANPHTGSRESTLSIGIY